MRKASKPQNILFFVGNMSMRGGTERMTASVATGLHQAGYAVSILSMHGGQSSHYSIPAGVQLITVLSEGQRRSLNLAQVVRRIRHTVINQKIDVWIDAESVLAATSFPALMGLSRRHITWENFNAKTNLGSPIRSIARSIAARWADAVIVLTQQDRQDWLSLYRPRAHIACIPNCLSDQFNPVVPLASTQQRQHVVAAGRLAKQKGFDLLLHSWKQISTKHPQWQLKIIGDGPERERLHNLAKQLGIQRSVIWRDFTDNLATEYQQASIYCLSSRFEGFGLVLIEAMAAGLPVVSFDCHAGPNEIVLHEQTGLLVESGNIDGLASALDQLMRDPSMRRQMIGAAQERAKRWTWANLRQSWLQIIEPDR